MDKSEVAEIFQEIGVLLEIKGENPFKCRAYTNAARTIDACPDSLQTLVNENRLSELKGIGAALQEKITTLIETGSLPFYSDLKASLPEGLLQLLEIPGLGPKKIKILYSKLKITSIEELEKACQQDQLAQLDGFGPKTASNLLAGIEQMRSYANQYRYGTVLPLAEELVETLRAHPDVIRINLAGSLRRGKEIVKDIDIIASAKNSKNIMSSFVNLDEVERIINHGETKSSILLKKGVQCDLRIVSDSDFSNALHHFTGSKEHNVAIRQLAIKQGMKVSEWGLFEVTKKKEEKRIPCRDEAELFDHLGLDYIPPELRENLGEIEAAQEETLPKLVEWSQFRGCFHNHTVASDGKNTLEEMAEAAIELGFEYLGIADHSKSSFQANGLSEERLLEQVKAIHSFNENQSDLHLFAGVECDILKDGSLDYDDSILAQLDYVVASVHSSFSLSEKEMTKRLIKVIENPHITMLGHLTGRLLLEREPYAVNIPKIIDAAAQNETWIELNASPYRLDMDWRHWKQAKEKGVKCVINPDAHRTSQLAYVKIGAQIARKGWLEKKDVINCLSLSEVKEILI